MSNHDHLYGVVETTTTTQNKRNTRTGVHTSVVEEFAEQRADRVVSTNISQRIRSKDITVTGENFKPNTRYYMFFDGIDVNAHMTATATAYDVLKAGTPAKGTGIKTNTLGKLIATFSIPDTDALNFSTGTKALKVTDSSTNDGNSLSQGTAHYEASGTLTVIAEDTIATRNGRIITQDISEENITTEVISVEEEAIAYTDPLAQSFLVKMKGGVFITSAEFYFGDKPDDLPVWVQIRHMENGFPTPKLVSPDFAFKSLAPADVNVSADASISTKFTFPSPVYLDKDREYCVVLMSNSDVYTAWVSEMGQRDVLSNDFIDQQPSAGSLFMSQNNNTWTPDQARDLKMKLNRASFSTTAGSVVFENDTLPVETLLENPIETISGTKTFKVRHFSHGNYDQAVSNITITGVAADRSGSVLRWTDDTVESTSGDAATDNSLSIVGTGGTGTGITATLTTVDDDSTTCVITNPGTGYTVGDDITFAKNSENFVFDVAEIGDTLGGIPISFINATHNAADMSSAFKADIDEYLITIPVATWAARVSGTTNTGLNVQGATENIVGGGTAVTSSNNIYYDVLHTAIPSFTLPNTTITATFTGTDATQPILNSTANGYTKNTTSTTITLNDNNFLSAPKMVASGINESAEMSSDKSFTLTNQINTTLSNVSPVIDIEEIGALGVQNRINRVDTSADVQAGTYVAATEARGDSNASIYITKRVQLENPANAIHIFFDGYRISAVNGTTDTSPTIDVYYKVIGPDDNLQFNDIGWTLGTIKKTVQPDSTDYREYEYNIEALEDFTGFAIKLVLQSSDSSNPPLVENFRAIALST
jgi:hypothetical protein